MGMLEVITRTAVQAFVRSRLLSGFGPSDFFLWELESFYFLLKLKSTCSGLPLKESSKT